MTVQQKDILAKDQDQIDNNVNVDFNLNYRAVLSFYSHIITKTVWTSAEMNLLTCSPKLYVLQTSG